MPAAVYYSVRLYFVTKKTVPKNSPFFLVPVVGVEPTRYRYHGILSPARLPIPPHRQIYYQNIITHLIYVVKGKIAILWLFFLTFKMSGCIISVYFGYIKGEVDMSKRNSISTKTLTYAAIMTALVIVLQFMGSFIKFGMFSISLVLVPIVIGTALCGVWTGAWLGLVFGLVVLISGDAGAFLAVNVPGTIITVLVKGIACGALAGLTYKAVSRINRYAAVVTAAVVCPLVNTGVFLLGCLAFFMPTLAEWALSLGFGDDVARYMIFVLVGGNFLFELGFNIVLSPVVVRLIDLANKK